MTNIKPHIDLLRGLAHGEAEAAGVRFEEANIDEQTDGFRVSFSNPGEQPWASWVRVEFYDVDAAVRGIPEAEKKVTRLVRKAARDCCDRRDSEAA